MQKKRFPSPLVLAAVLFGAAASAGAIGFGEASPAATLGQPLDFSVELRLAPGETVAPGCVRAVVRLADVAQPAGAVSATLQAGARGETALIRVRTRERIVEPVVTVDVAAGCPAVLSRQFVLFADPPERVARPVSADAVLQVPPQATSAAPATAPAASRAAPSNTPSANLSAPPAAGPPNVAAAPAPAVGRAPAARPAARPRRAVAAAPRPAPAPRPRLVLDAAPPAPAAPAPMVLSDEALALIEQTNEAVKAAIAEIKASQARLAAQDAELQRLRAEAAAQRAREQQLRDAAAAAAARTRWVMPLVLASLALLALAGWLWWRVRVVEGERRLAWQEAARRAPPAPPAVPPAPSQVPLLVERSVRTAGAAALGAGLAPVHEPSPSELPEPAPAVALAPEPPAQQTLPLPSAGAGEEGRDVSAEELIDLEQQAEFFVVLGQDDAAIDLLVSHLRDTGGASPLPYLKLMDIYQRLGDAEAYGRTRDRFNHRFNAHAPAWDRHAQAARTLEDYPQVIHWLQQVWPRPLDAMAELETLLFRRDGGELFDLPAYRELLLLYALARDRLDDASAPAGAAVDVLLPLGDAPDFDTTGTRPYFLPDEGRRPQGDAATQPVDLDLDLDLSQRP